MKYAILFWGQRVGGEVDYIICFFVGYFVYEGWFLSFVFLSGLRGGRGFFLLGCWGLGAW